MKMSAKFLLVLTLGINSGTMLGAAADAQKIHTKYKISFTIQLSTERNPVFDKTVIIAATQNTPVGDLNRLAAAKLACQGLGEKGRCLNFCNECRAVDELFYPDSSYTLYLSNSSLSPDRETTLGHLIKTRQIAVGADGKSIKTEFIFRNPTVPSQGAKKAVVHAPIAQSKTTKTNHLIQNDAGDSKTKK